MKTTKKQQQTFYTSLRNRNTKEEYLQKVNGKELDKDTYIYNGNQVFNMKDKWYVIDTKTGKSIATGKTRKETITNYYTVQPKYNSIKSTPLYKKLADEFKKLVNIEKQKIKELKGE